MQNTIKYHRNWHSVVWVVKICINFIFEFYCINNRSLQKIATRLILLLLFTTYSNFGVIILGQLRKIQRGVTLVEVLFAVVIMTLIALISFNQYQKTTFKNQITQVKSSVEQLKVALNAYYYDHCHSYIPAWSNNIHLLEPYLANPENLANPWRGNLSLNESYAWDFMSTIPPKLSLRVYFPDIINNKDKVQVVAAALQPSGVVESQNMLYFDMTPTMVGTGQQQLGTGFSGVTDYSIKNPVNADAIEGEKVHQPCWQRYENEQ
jgi:prepilin-type N-terminal cleavage/methylation domain-containing protein